MKLAGAGLTYDNPEDIVKDTYTLEFLGIPAKERYSEKDLKSAPIANLTKFLLELGKGFSFQACQYPIVINNEHYYLPDKDQLRALIAETLSKQTND